MGGGVGALGARTRTPMKIWINFGAPPRVAPLTSPPGAPQRQLSVTGTDRTLLPLRNLDLVVSVLLVDCERDGPARDT